VREVNYDLRSQDNRTIASGIEFSHGDSALSEQLTPWKRRRFSMRWGVVGVVIAGFLAFLAISRPWEESVSVVATETLTAGPVSQVLAINGRIAALKSVTVRAAVSAQAMSVLVDEGDEVASGDVLVRLDTALADAQVHQARAGLEAQEAREQQAKATVDRARALGSISARSVLEDAELTLASAQKETARLRAALDQVQSQLAQYTIAAPIDGVVLSRGVDQGQLVDPQNELFVIANTSELVVETDIDELYSAHVRVGLPALLKPLGTSVARNGKVVFAAPAVESSTGGRKIKIAFDENQSLPIGLTVNVNVIVHEVENALSLPRGAIVSEGAQSYVLVLENGIATRRDVRFEDWPSERVIATEGVAEGDVVILDPGTVRPGDKVEAE
jgi:RND family efflux transporter MFP subunit